MAYLTGSNDPEVALVRRHLRRQPGEGRVIGPLTQGTDDEFVLYADDRSDWSGGYRAVASVGIVCESAAITGAATNNITLTVTRRNNAGTVVTTLGSITFANGTNAAQFSPTLIPLTGGPVAFSPGDVITLAVTHAGTGMALPRTTVFIDITGS